ncbi:hypothetical protein D3C86_1137350 [compost metagenome]
MAYQLKRKRNHEERLAAHIAACYKRIGLLRIQLALFFYNLVHILPDAFQIFYSLGFCFSFPTVLLIKSLFCSLSRFKSSIFNSGVVVRKTRPSHLLHAFSNITVADLYGICIFLSIYGLFRRYL